MADSRPKNSPGDSDTSWRPRFGLLSLFLLMMAASVTMAVFGGLLRNAGRAPDSPAFVIFAAAAPLGLVVLLGTARSVWKLASRRRSK